MRNREAVEPEVLFDAAWAALLTGRPVQLENLRKLLLQPVAAGAIGSEQLLRLQLLLAATARNLRMLRGEFRLQPF